MLEFKENTRSLTLGAEVELQVLNESNLELVPRATDVLNGLEGNHLAKEMFRSTLEVVSEIASNAHELIEGLSTSIDAVMAFGSKVGLRFASTGTHPSADYHDRVLSDSHRYEELLDRNQWLIRRMAVYGLHVHVGMRNGDEAIRFQNFFLRHAPILIVLSGSSPFWRGYHTGLSSSRPTMYEAHPVSGIPFLAKDWSDFNRVYRDMLQTGSINGMKDIWWDIRPSPGYGTIELRMCDGVATIGELRAICALIHSMAIWFDQQDPATQEALGSPPERWILRENKWRAIRFGTNARFINQDTLSVVPAKECLEHWIERITDISMKYDYQGCMDMLRDIITSGNSSERQCKLISALPGERLSADDVKKVMAFNIEELEKGNPIWTN